MKTYHSDRLGKVTVPESDVQADILHGQAQVDTLSELSRLRAHNSRLREALRSTLRALETHLDLESKRENISRAGLCPCELNEVAQARSALEGRE